MAKVSKHTEEVVASIKKELERLEAESNAKSLTPSKKQSLLARAKDVGDDFLKTEKCGDRGRGVRVSGECAGGCEQRILHP